MKLPPLNALRAFEAAARNNSFSRAGDELHVTHAAISHQIKNLEAWFGSALFHREGRGIRLTRTGQALAGRTIVIFEELEDTCQRLRVSKHQQNLAVGCIPSIATRWLLPRLAGFSQAHPEIQIQVLYAQANQCLSDGDYDVLITFGEDSSDQISNEKLFSRASKPVCSPHYLMQHGPINSAKEISACDLLHDETREGWREWFSAADLPLHKGLTGPVFQDLNLLATSVIAGHGLALCPVEVFRDELAQGDLVVVSDIETKTDKNYFVITKTAKSNPVEKFTQWFFAEVQ